MPHRSEGRVNLPVGFRNLDGADLTLFEEQAATLEGKYNHRPGTGRLFALLVAAAREWRRENGNLGGMAVSAQVDPTAPLADQVDDIAAVMAEAMVFVDDPNLSVGLRNQWNEVLRSLAADIRRRQRAR